MFGVMNELAFQGVSKKSDWLFPNDGDYRKQIIRGKPNTDNLPSHLMTRPAQKDYKTGPSRIVQLAEPKITTPGLTKALGNHMFCKV